MEPHFGSCHAALSAGRPSLGLAHRGTCPRSLDLVEGVGLLFAKRWFLHPLNHTLFTVAQVSEQLFLLPSIFKVTFWTLCIWMPKGMLSELRPPKMLQNCMICALTATILKYLLTFSAHTQQDHHGYFSLPYHWVKAFFEILLSFRENNTIMWEAQPTLSQSGDSGVV